MKLSRIGVKKARIEMLPLIDIVFLLLVFFIYAMLSMAVHRGMEVNLPVSATAGVEKELILAVTLQPGGSLHLDKTPIGLEALTEELRQRTAGSENPGVLLFAGRTVRYERLFQVLDRIRQAGISRISLQARPEAEP